MNSDDLEKKIWQELSTVIDPELGIDIVSLGLVYEVVVKSVQEASGSTWRVHIVYTLTTPGCPLAQVISEKIKEACLAVPGLVAKNVTSELVFDPPWVPDMMSESAREEMDFLL